MSKKGVPPIDTDKLLAEFNLELSEFDERRKKLAPAVEKYRESSRTLIEAEKVVTSELGKQAKSLKRLNELAPRLVRAGAVDAKQAQQYEADFTEGQTEVDNATKIIPKSGSWFTRLFLGSANNIVFADTQRKLAFKEEYETFKYRATILSVPYFLIMLYMPSLGGAVETAYQTFLLYYYATITLRENILQANGSNIKQWWTWHHYLSVLTALVLLLWPDGPGYQEFRYQLYVYSLYSASTQVLQYIYQSKRLYVLKSLGRADVLDVANSETPQMLLSANFFLLLPVLFVGHGFQIHNAYVLTINWLRYGETETILLAALFAIVGVGNLYTTVLVVRNKFAKDRSSKITHK